MAINGGKKTTARSYRTRGVNASKLSMESRMLHEKGEPQALLEAEVVRRFIDANLCPYCSRGPFKNLAGHTIRTHGIDRRELREAAGVPLSYPVASPDLRALKAEQGKASGFGAAHDPSEMGKRGGAAPHRLSSASRDAISQSAKRTWQERSRIERDKFEARRQEGITAVSRRLQGDALKERNQARRDILRQQWERTDQSSKALREMAQRAECSLSVMRRRLRRSGATVPDGRREVSPEVARLRGEAIRQTLGEKRAARDQEHQMLGFQE